MTVLGIDTTSEQGSLCWTEKGKTSVTSIFEGGRRHSFSLFSAVSKLLREQKRDLPDVDLFGVTTGPGSFTGIRVGLATVKGWAETLNKPVVGVSVFEAMVFSANPRTSWAVPIVNGDRGQIYFSFFQSLESEGSFKITEEPIVMGIEGFISCCQEKIPGQNEPTFITLPNQDLINKLSHIHVENLIWKYSSLPISQTVAHIAKEKFIKGKISSAEEVKPLYIRRPDAEIQWQDD